MDREDVTMGRVGWALAVTVIQHLHLNGAQKRLTRCREWPGPNEDPGIALGDQVPPFQLQNEVLILPLRAQRSGRHSITMQHALPHRPCLRSTVHIHPA